MPRNVTNKSSLKETTAIPPQDESVDNQPVSNEPVDLPPFTMDEMQEQGRTDIADVVQKSIEVDKCRQHLAYLIMARFDLRIANGEELKWPTAYQGSAAGMPWQELLRDAKQFFLGEPKRAGRKDITPAQVEEAGIYRRDEEHVSRSCKLAVDIRMLGGTWHNFNQDTFCFDLPREMYLMRGDMWLDFKVENGQITVMVPEHLPMIGKGYSIKTGTGAYTTIFTSMSRINDVAADRRKPVEAQGNGRDTQLPVASADEAKATIAAIDALEAKEAATVTVAATNADPLVKTADQENIELRDARDSIERLATSWNKAAEGKPGASRLTAYDFSRDGQLAISLVEDWIIQYRTRTAEVTEERNKMAKKAA